MEGRPRGWTRSRRGRRRTSVDVVVARPAVDICMYVCNPYSIRFSPKFQHLPYFFLINAMGERSGFQGHAVVPRSCLAPRSCAETVPPAYFVRFYLPTKFQASPPPVPLPELNLHPDRACLVPFPAQPGQLQAARLHLPRPDTCNKDCLVACICGTRLG